MVKLIASDMDGTLVNSSHRISKKNVTAIKKAQAQGIEFIISTGRAYEDVTTQVNEAGLTCSYMLMNGSEIRSSSGEIMQSLYIDRELVERIVKKLEAENLYIELYTNAHIYSISDKELCKRATATKTNFFFPEISLKDAYAKAEEHEQYKKVTQIDNLHTIWNANEEVGKIISFSNDTRKLASLRTEIPLQFGACASGSFPINLEITHPDASKGTALKKYVLKKQIALAEVMTIGDSYNDLSMIMEDFGYTVAMGNAIEEIKQAAKYVTGTNDEDGVCTIIEQFMNG